VVSTQVVVPGLQVGEQVADDGEHRVAGGDDRLLFAAAFGDTPVLEEPTMCVDRSVQKAQITGAECGLQELGRLVKRGFGRSIVGVPARYTFGENLTSEFLMSGAALEAARVSADLGGVRAN
jgi:hypothetical protein